MSLNALTLGFPITTNIKNNGKKKIFKISKKKMALPWVEKYRPNSISDLILDDMTNMRIKKMIDKKQLSNMIMTGSSGTGKTSSILCLAKHILQDSYKDAVLELNASDNRGLDTINNSIIHFCRKKVSLDKGLHKLIILDEADNITKKAQYALTNLMEKFRNTTKFAFTCNNSNKIVESIQTRCIILRYNHIKNNSIIDRLKKICKKEKIDYTISGLNTIAFISQGDVRKAINYLESTYYGFNKITVDNIYKICEKPPQVQITNIINQCISGNLQDAIKDTLSLKKTGYSNNDILKTIIDVLKEINVTESRRIKMLNCASESFLRINEGVDTDLQILNCLCGFYKIGCKK